MLMNTNKAQQMGVNEHHIAQQGNNYEMWTTKKQCKKETKDHKS